MLLPSGTDGKLFIFRNQIAHIFDFNDSTETTYDARDGGAAQPDNRHEFFCAAHVVLPNSGGKVLLVGGNRRYEVAAGKFLPHTQGWASLFDPEALSDPFYGDTTDTDLPVATGMDTLGVHVPIRWYPTITELPDGKMLVTGGTYWIDVDADSIMDGNETSFRQKRWVVLDSWSSTPGVPWTWDVGWEGYQEPTPSPIWTRSMPEYPHFKTLPSGLFYSGNNSVFPGGYSRLWPWYDTSEPASVETSNKIENERDSGCAVILTLDVNEPARVMHVGGDSLGAPNEPATAEIISYTTGNPVSDGLGWQPAVPVADGEFLLSANGRRRTDAVLLADGSVLVVGGEYYDGSNLHTPNWEVELFDDDPVSPSWAAMDSIGAPRRYHSEAILLPDGRVFVAGDEAEAPPVTSVDSSGTYEIFYPPYLFESASAWAKRPILPSDISSVTYGVPFVVPVGHEDATMDANDIGEVVLMAPGTSTHSTNMTQRRLRLATTVLDDSTLVVAGPRDGTWAPPGEYMLIVLDTDGVPSVADFLTVSADSANTIASGESSAWFGDVYLDRDFVVEQGGSLTILPGTTVQVEPVDAHNLGVETMDVELIARGDLVAEGTPGSEIVFTLASGTVSGDWRGIRFEKVNSDSTTCGSRIRYAQIEYAKFAIAVEDTCAPEIAYVECLNSQSGDVYIDGVDTVIEQSCEWILGWPTSVVVKNAVTTEVGAMTNQMADLVVRGVLKTVAHAGATPQDSVTFYPESPTASPNDPWEGDWGGIFVDWTSQGSILQRCSISHAENPIFLNYADDVYVFDCSIHTYSGVGITVSGSSGAELRRNQIDRGAGVDRIIEQTGILLKKTATRVVDNVVGVHSGLNEATLRIENTKLYCLSAAASPETLSVHSNVFAGAGQADTTVAKITNGVLTSWLCGAGTLRKAEIVGNVIRDFNSHGLKLSQAEDLQVDCNKISNNKHGLLFSRTSNPSGPQVRFKNNEIDSSHTDLIWSDNVKKMKLGGTVTINRGSNIIRRLADSTLFVHSSDAVNTLEAQNNQWHDGNAAALDSVPLIESLIASASDASSPKTALMLSCTPSRTLAGMQSSVADELESTSNSEGLPRSPRVTSIGQPQPVPFREKVWLELSVGSQGSEHIQVAVYDVLGRHVRELTNGMAAPGSYRIRWDGRNGSGERVAAGVYFLRSEVGRMSRTAKVVVVR